MPTVSDPVIQLACLDASLAMKPVFTKFQSVIITSGTLSPIDLYPRILNFSPVICQSLNMTLTRCVACRCHHHALSLRTVHRRIPISAGREHVSVPLLPS